MSYPSAGLTRTITVAIALGSNLGDRRGHLEWALEQLSSHLSHLTASTIVETEAQDVPDTQPPYLNAVATGRTDLSPRGLLELLLGLETARGRTRTKWRAARTLDLDLILYGDVLCNEPDLIVPHPHFRERRFVLEPLAQIAPAMVDPVTGRTVRELYESLTGAS